MKKKRKDVTYDELKEFCTKRKQALKEGACYTCPMKMRLSASTYCLTEISDLLKNIDIFVNTEIELDEKWKEVIGK